jgi:hypothetical protein
MDETSANLGDFFYKLKKKVWNPNSLFFLGLNGGKTRSRYTVLIRMLLFICSSFLYEKVKKVDYGIRSRN